MGDVLTKEERKFVEQMRALPGVSRDACDDASVAIIDRLVARVEKLEKVREAAVRLRNLHVETTCCGNSEWRGKLCLYHQGVAAACDTSEEAAE